MLVMSRFRVVDTGRIESARMNRVAPAPEKTRPTGLDGVSDQRGGHTQERIHNEGP